MLLHGHRIVGSALDRRVVDDDGAVGALDPADPGDQPGRGDVAAIHPERGELADLEEGRARVDQAGQALAGKQLAPFDMSFALLFRSAHLDNGSLLAQFGEKRAHAQRILAECIAVGGDGGFQNGHAVVFLSENVQGEPERDPRPRGATTEVRTGSSEPVSLSAARQIGPRGIRRSPP